MAARQYGQFLPSDGGDVGEGSLIFPAAPLTIRAGQWRIFWIPKGGYTSPPANRVLLSIGPLGGAPTFLLRVCDFEPDTPFFEVRGDWGVVASPPVAAVPGREIQLDLDAVAGKLTVISPVSGSGTFLGDPWAGEVDDNYMRLGGSTAGDGEPAFGWVSLPYSIKHAMNLGGDGALWFNDAGNSAHLPGW